jgi:hypothetical protein
MNEREVYSHFYKSLNSTQKQRLLLERASNLEEAISILQEFETLNGPHKPNSNTENTKHLGQKKNLHSSRFTAPTTANIDDKNQYCSRHKTNGHSNENCLAQKAERESKTKYAKGFEQSKSNTTTTTPKYLMKEEQNLPIIIEGSINCDIAGILIDTGANKNFISERTVKNSKLTAIKKEYPT